MQAENLWGNLGVDDLTPAPINLLREQALALTTLSKGLLVGVASSVPMPQTSVLMCTLSIRVPGLNNYEVALLYFKQPLLLYPLTVVDRLRNKSYDCLDYAQFRTILVEILTNESTKRVISGLWVQVQG